MQANVGALLAQGKNVVAWCALVVMLLAVWPAKSAEVEKKEGKSTLVQFWGQKPDALPDILRAPLVRDCGVQAPPVVATVSAAVGAILIDWLVSRGVAAANERLDKYIAEHTVTYRNALNFTDIGAPALWGLDANGKETNKAREHPVSCVAVIREDCPVATDSSDTNSKPAAPCTGRLYFVAALRHEGNYLRVAPVALYVDQIEARHARGKATAAVSLQIHGIANAEMGGQRWTSGEVALAAESFDAGKSVPKKGIRGDVDRLFDYGSDPQKSAARWEKAAVMPLPPDMRAPNTQVNPSVAAIEISIAEAGKPGFFGSNLANLMKAKGSDLGGVLGTALKKQAGVAGEE